jgi:hypothetical protein
MTDAGLHMMPLHILPETGAKLLSGERLAKAAYIVALPFDSQERGAANGLRVRPCTSSFPSAKRWSWKTTFTVSR